MIAALNAWFMKTCMWLPETCSCTRSRGSSRGDLEARPSVLHSQFGGRIERTMTCHSRLEITEQIDRSVMLGLVGSVSWEAEEEADQMLQPIHTILFDVVMATVEREIDDTIAERWE